MTANTDIVAKAYAAFAAGDIPTILDMLTDDIVWSAPRTLPHGGQFAGKAEVLSFFQGIGAAWEKVSLDVESISDAGGVAVGVVRADGIRRGAGAAGYGAVHLFTVRDGKVARFREYTDLDAPLA